MKSKNELKKLTSSSYSIFACNVQYTVQYITAQTGPQMQLSRGNVKKLGSLLSGETRTSRLVEGRSQFYRTPSQWSRMRKIPEGGSDQNLLAALLERLPLLSVTGGKSVEAIEWNIFTFMSKALVREQYCRISFKKYAHVSSYFQRFALLVESTWAGGILKEVDPQSTVLLLYKRSIKIIVSTAEYRIIFETYSVWKPLFNL